MTEGRINEFSKTGSDRSKCGKWQGTSNPIWKLAKGFLSLSFPLNFDSYTARRVYCNSLENLKTLIGTQYDMKNKQHLYKKIQSNIPMRV